MTDRRVDPGAVPPRPPHGLEAAARRLARRACREGVRVGLPPAWVGWRHVEKETLAGHVARLRAAGVAGARIETVQPEAVAENPLPVNVARREDLPDDAGWWGYSMRDVPARTSGETLLATIPDALVVPIMDDRGEFRPAILGRDGRALALREIDFRDVHARALRERRPALRLDRATWIAERVCDNHSHWLTAHLPKLSLLASRGELGDVLLPERLTPAMEASIRLMGLEPGSFRRFEPLRPLKVGELTVLSTDRFRPDLLRPVRDAIAPPREAGAATRRVYISRSRARMRRLLNEEEVWPLFEAAGFERVHMEALSFEEQVALMRETRVLAAPHGAGLTNMMFCPPGSTVVEIACLGFPNPNFYALASAMGLRYALVPAEARGDVEPLEQDLVVDPDALRPVLAGLGAPLTAGAGEG